MDATKRPALAAPIYEDFVPTSELVSDEDCDTLLIHLPGFKKEQLRVQLTKGILRITGSIPIGDNKMRRFQKEFQASPNCDTSKISARFESGILHVKQPKLITPATPSAKPEHPKLPSTPRISQESNMPTNEPQATKNAAEKASGNKKGGEAEEGKKTSSENEKNTAELTRNEEKTKAKNDGIVNTRTDNYRKMVGAMRHRLKMQRRVVNVVLAAIFTFIIAIYVNNLFTSFRQPKN